MAEREDLRPMWEAVGRMTANFAVLEFVLHHLVWTMVDHGNRALRVVTRVMGFGELVDLGEALVKAGFPPDDEMRGRLRDLLRGLKRVNEERNAFTHALVGQFGEEVQLARVRDAIREEVPSKRVSVSEVEDLILRSGKLIRVVVELNQEMRPASRGKK